MSSDSEEELSGDEDLPTPWKASLVTGKARRVFEKHRAGDVGVGRSAFEKIVCSVMGGRAGSKANKSKRSSAWFALKDPCTESVTFSKFLSALTSSGVTPRMLSEKFEDALDPSRRPAQQPGLLCPQCREPLPDTFVLRQEDDDDNSETRQVLKKLEDIQRRRESIHEDARRKGISVEQLELRSFTLTPGWGMPKDAGSNSTSNAASAPASPRVDPRVMRLRTEEKEAAAAAAETLLALGFNEILDVEQLAASLKRADSPRPAPGPNPAPSPSPPPPPPPTLPSLPSQARRFSQPSPRARTAAAAQTFRRQSTTASSTPPPQRPGATLSIPRASSGATLKRSVGGGTGGLQAWCHKQPPELLPVPLAVPNGLFLLETLQQPLQLRRTASLVEAVRRSEVRMAKQWADNNRVGLNVFVDGKTTLAHLALESKKGSSELLRTVSTPENLAAWNEYGETPTHLAARQGYADKIKVLADLGAPLSEAFDARSETPLHTAARAATCSAAAALLEAGADAGALSGSGRPALMVASTPEMVAVLLEKGKGAGTCARDPEGCTALHWVVRGGVFEGAEDHPALAALVKSCDADATNAAGDTALHVALCKGDPQIAEVLSLHGASLAVPNSLGRSAVTVAQQRWQHEAGSAAQLPWSSLLAAWGWFPDKPHKGASWHHRTAFGWVPLDPPDLQDPCTELHKAVSSAPEDGLCWQHPDPQPSWATVAATLCQPDKGMWNRIRASLPKTLSPCRRISLSFYDAAAAAAAAPQPTVKYQLRYLPNV